MAFNVKIYTSFGNGGTIKTLSNILKQRMEYLHETARDSVAATAIDALKSIRAATLVAKKSHVKVNVKNDKTLMVSISTKGHYKELCIRYKSSKQRYTGPEKQLFYGKGEIKDQHVFRFTDENSKNKTQYLLCADNLSMAKNIAKKIVQRRALRYAGLAKNAIGQLMHKTATVNTNDNVDPIVESVAQTNTSKYENVKKVGDAGGYYILTLSDNLRYALDAIKGGKVGVDTALKKAMNKVVSVINRKAFKNADGGFLSPKPLPVPFPEVRKRKK